jgi:hypothetical protein
MQHVAKALTQPRPPRAGPHMALAEERERRRAEREAQASMFGSASSHASSIEERMADASTRRAQDNIEAGAKRIESRVNTSWARICEPEDPVSKLHPKLATIKLEDPDSVIVDMALVQPHVKNSDGVRDEDGQPISWAWGEDTAAYRPGKRVHDTGIGIGPIAPSAEQWHRLDRVIRDGIDNATVDGNMGRDKTGVKAWFKFWEDEGGSPHRMMDPYYTTIHAKLAEELKCMQFLAALVEERGISPESAAVYFSQTQGWHSREHGIKLCGGLKLSRLPQMIKGWKRLRGAKPPRVRRAIAPQKLREAMDLLLDKNNPDHACIRAAVSLALLGLLRSAEYCMTGSIKWNKKDHLTRADLAELTARRLVLWMHPCKNMHHLKGKTVPLVIGAGGMYIDAVAEMLNYLRLDPDRDEDTPLFKLPSTGEALRDSDVMAWTRAMMAAVGLDPNEYGTHSYRIAGATALFAQGADPTVIRTMGRWSSDIYRLYVRACFERCCQWTSRAGSCAIIDSVVDFEEVDDY